jgi:type IV fimbrial biogenesis protein FimT
MLGPLKPLRRRAGGGRRAGAHGLTLVELMVVVAVAVIILGLAAPSFSDYVVTQRVRSVHAQVNTDVQFARSEAMSRGSFVGMRFRHASGAGGQSCYIIFTRPEPVAGTDVTCDCLQPEGQRCNPLDGTTEVRTVAVPNSLKVGVRVPDGQTDTLNFDPRSGAVKVLLVDTANAVPPPDFLVNTAADSARTLRTVVTLAGRPGTCTPTGSNLGGAACGP